MHAPLPLYVLVLSQANGVGPITQEPAMTRAEVTVAWHAQMALHATYGSALHARVVHYEEALALEDQPHRRIHGLQPLRPAFAVVAALAA